METKLEYFLSIIKKKIWPNEEIGSEVLLRVKVPKEKNHEMQGHRNHGTRGG